MKKIAILLIISAILYLTTIPTLAGGDQHQGDNGKGAVVQHQVRNS